MNKQAVLKHLEAIRHALYTGQITVAKVAAQRSFEALCLELGEAPAAESYRGTPTDTEVDWAGNPLPKSDDIA